MRNIQLILKSEVWLTLALAIFTTPVIVHAQEIYSDSDAAAIISHNYAKRKNISAEAARRELVAGGALKSTEDVVVSKMTPSVNRPVNNSVAHTPAAAPAVSMDTVAKTAQTRTVVTPAPVDVRVASGVPHTGNALAQKATASISNVSVAATTEHSAVHSSAEHAVVAAGSAPVTSEPTVLAMVTPTQSVPRASSATNTSELAIWTPLKLDWRLLFNSSAGWVSWLWYMAAFALMFVGTIFLRHLLRSPAVRLHGLHDGYKSYVAKQSSSSSEDINKAVVTLSNVSYYVPADELACFEELLHAVVTPVSDGLMEASGVIKETFTSLEDVDKVAGTQPTTLLNYWQNIAAVSAKNELLHHSVVHAAMPVKAQERTIVQTRATDLERLCVDGAQSALKLLNKQPALGNVLPESKGDLQKTSPKIPLVAGVAECGLPNMALMSGRELLNTSTVAMNERLDSLLVGTPVARSSTYSDDNRAFSQTFKTPGSKLRALLKDNLQTSVVIKVDAT